MFADDLIHLRLRHHGLVLLIVAKAAETNHVNHNIFMKPHTEIKSQLSHHDHRFRIIAIDMKNRRFDHLGDISTVQCRAAVARIGCGKSDLIIDDDMHRATRTISTSLRQIERFHDDALPGKCCIAMY